jgi:hypothetical protein
MVERRHETAETQILAESYISVNMNFLTSHVPIFNALAGKFEAFNRSPADDAPDLRSFFLEGSALQSSVEDCPALEFA